MSTWEFYTHTQWQMTVFSADDDDDDEESVISLFTESHVHIFLKKKKGIEMPKKWKSYAFVYERPNQNESTEREKKEMHG